MKTKIKMKKIIKNAIYLIVIVGIIFISCNKENELVSLPHNQVNDKNITKTVTAK